MATSACHAPHDAPRIKNLAFQDLSGAKHNLFEPTRKGTVYFFIAHDCPVANSYVPEMNRIAAKYRRSGMMFFAVYTEKEFGRDAALKHYKEFGFTFPAALDNHRRLTRALSATVTPEAAVVDRNGFLKYRGRIDDLYVAFGQRRHKPTTHDLRKVLDAIASKKAVQYTSTKSVGCFIPKD